MSKTVDLPSWLPQGEASPETETRLALSESEVRSLPRFKHASLKEVEHIITSLHHLALVAYEAYSRAEGAKAAGEAAAHVYSEEKVRHEEEPLRWLPLPKAA